MRIRIISRVTLAALVLAASSQVVAAPPAVAPAGFAICAACHTTSADKANGMGPNLRGVVGRKAAAVPGFNYSAAMKKSGITWTSEELDAYLTAPRKRVPGTSMAYFGMSNTAKRKEIVTYLGTLK